MAKFYGATSLIGGGTGALDNIDGAALTDLDGAVVITDGIAYFYHLDATSAAGESSPDIISPDDNAGTKRWILTGIRSGDVIVSGFLDLFHTAVMADDHAFEIDVDAAGFGDVKAIDIDYITGNISQGKDEGIILLNIDQITGAPATGGEVFGLEVLATEGSAEITGVKVGAVVNPIHQDSGTFENPDIGTNDTPQTPVANMIDGICWS